MSSEGLSADMGEPIPPNSRLHWLKDWVPSEGESLPPRRYSDQPDLVFDHQLQGLLLAGIMRQHGIFVFELDSVAVAQLRHEKIRVTETEHGGIKVTRES